VHMPTGAFEIVVAWYFAAVLGGQLTVVGPFSTDSQCERTHLWATKTARAVVSDCFYGPAISVTRKPTDGGGR